MNFSVKDNLKLTTELSKCISVGGSLTSDITILMVSVTERLGSPESVDFTCIVNTLLSSKFITSALLPIFNVLPSNTKASSIYGSDLEISKLKNRNEYNAGMSDW